MSKSIFRAAEILDMALRIENRGVSFYSGCAAKSRSPRTKEVFAFLENQEKMHYQIFARMKAEPDEALPAESYPGEYQGYVEAFVKDKVFDSSEAAAQKAESIDDPLDAIDWALTFEQRSIDFYTAMAANIRSSEAETIDKIIGEEKRHIDQLNGLRRSLTSEGDAEKIE